jgi:imidazolonepropionase-like amidohydrolase
MRRHLKNARLVDGTGTPPREPAMLLIEGDTIVHAGRPLPAGRAGPGEAEVIDVGRRSVIPGLVEAHRHLPYDNVKAAADLDLDCGRRVTRNFSLKEA